MLGQYLDTNTVAFPHWHPVAWAHLDSHLPSQDMLTPNLESYFWYPLRVSCSVIDCWEYSPALPNDRKPTTSSSFHRCIYSAAKKLRPSFLTGWPRWLLFFTQTLPHPQALPPSAKTNFIAPKRKKRKLHLCTVRYKDISLTPVHIFPQLKTRA